MGLALCWKPKGIPSQKFLGVIKNHLKLEGKSRRGIGHSGTLDPFACGLLCVAWGEGTKLLHPLTHLPKSYRSSMLIGLKSETYDIEGEELAPHQSDKWKELLDKDASFFQNFLESKIGSFMQRPPEYSAIKINGQRAYELARQKKDVQLKEREVSLYFARHISVSAYEYQGHPVLKWDFEVMVSSGTYIRAFARDWSMELCGESSCLMELERSQIGPFRMDHPPAEKDREFAENQEPHIEKIDLEKLQELFSVYHLKEMEEEKLLNGGYWVAQENPKPLLLLNKSGHIRAWCQAQSGAIGRVFNAHPL